MPPYVLIQSNLITKAKSQDPPCLNTSPSLFAHFIINSTSNVVDTLRFPFSLFFYSLTLLPHTPILSPALFSRLNGSYYFFRIAPFDPIDLSLLLSFNFWRPVSGTSTWPYSTLRSLAVLMGPITSFVCLLSIQLTCLFSCLSYFALRFNQLHIPYPTVFVSIWAAFPISS